MIWSGRVGSFYHRVQVGFGQVENLSGHVGLFFHFGLGRVRFGFGSGLFLAGYNYGFGSSSDRIITGSVKIQVVFTIRHGLRPGTIAIRSSQVLTL